MVINELREGIEQDLVDFTESDQFKTFKKIMKDLYLAKLIEFQNSKENSELLSDKRILNVYLNLPELFSAMANEVVLNRQLDEERSNEFEENL